MPKDSMFYATLEEAIDAAREEFLANNPDSDEESASIEQLNIQKYVLQDGDIAWQAEFFADEDEQGEPFVGQAGKLLDAMLAAIDLQRGNKVYLTNVLKSRPPGNRDPEPDEIAACRPYLLAQIELIQPRLILALGRFAAQTLLETDETIGHLRGRVHAFRNVPVVVTYHPAYLLRNLPDKARAWEDLCLARRTFNSLTPES